jgi:hypothetical protein
MLGGTKVAVLSDPLAFLRIPPPGAALYYPMLQPIAQDMSGQGNSGTVSGATPGKLPSGLWYYDYDGADSYVDCGSDTSLDGTFDAGGTVMAWINPDSDGENDLGVIVSKMALPTTGWMFTVRDEAAGYLRFRLFQYFDAAADGNWRTTDAVVPIGSWSLVAVTYDNSAGANDPILYYNNTIPAITEDGTPGGDNAGSDAAKNLWIGSEDTQARTFDGKIGIVVVAKQIYTATTIFGFFNKTRHLYGV